MQGVATEKVPGGKLLRIKVDYGERIEKIRITGDFFMHPEEGIKEIENVLLGTDKNQDEISVAEKVAKVVKDKGIEMIGIDPAAIARVTKAAMK